MLTTPPIQHEKLVTCDPQIEILELNVNILHWGCWIVDEI